MSEHADKHQATETGPQMMDLDDHCLGQVLTRVSVFQSIECKSRSACGPLLRVCRRFRDVLLGHASRATISEPGDEALLRFACGLRVLIVYFPAVGRLSLSPPIVECLSGVTQLVLCDARYSDSIRDFAALPALVELRLANVLVPASEGEALLNHIAQLSLLSCLDIERARLRAAPERSFAGLTNLRHLRTLRITDCSTASSACLRFATALTGLSYLTLRALSALDVDGCIELASALPGLVSLDVNYHHATDEGLAHLSSLTLLSRLDLHFPHRSTRRAQFQAITQLRSLRYLVMSAEPFLDDEADAPPVLQLGVLQRLEHLRLYAERWQQVGALQGLTALTYLHIRSRCSELHGCEAAVAALTSLTSLRECCLQGLCGPASRAALGALRGLTKLEVRDSKLGDMLPELSRLTALEELRFMRVHLSEDGLAATLAAGAAASLRTLHICDRNDTRHQEGFCVSGGFLTALAALSSLTSLGIVINTIMDAQLAAVSTLARLRRLYLISQDKADVWSSGSIASVAQLTRLVSLFLEPGGHVCGSATSQLLSLQSLESLHIRAVGHAGSDFVRPLTDGLRRLQRLTGSVDGLPSAACAQLTQLTRLWGYLRVPTEGVKYVFGEPVQCRPIRSAECCRESSDESDDMEGSDESDGIDE